MSEQPQPQMPRKAVVGVDVSISWIGGVTTTKRLSRSGDGEHATDVFETLIRGTAEDVAEVGVPTSTWLRAAGHALNMERMEVLASLGEAAAARGERGLRELDAVEAAISAALEAYQAFEAVDGR